MRDLMHLDEEQVQRLLHGELGGPAATSVRHHLDTCPECRFRMTEAEGEEAWVLDRLGRLDHARPKLTAEAILGARPRRASGWGRMAAGIFLTLAAAGVAYAAPGSPLPRVIDRIINLVSRAPERPVKPAPSPSAKESQAGIAVAPGTRLTIVFLGDQSEDTAIISLTDSAEVMVRALGGTTTFTSEHDRLAIGHQGGPATFEILIPRTAPSVEVRAGGRRLLLKEGSGIITVARPNQEGQYLLPLSSSEP
jgi:hypothetical protein